MSKILLLGGTGWLGRTLGLLALEGRHQVTALARGTEAFAQGVDAVVADRDSPDAYAGVEDQIWDLVVELTSSPRFCREALHRLGGNARNWVFVSSCSVYAEQSVPGADETAEVLDPLDPGDGEAEADYGRAKSACEVLSMQARGGRALVVRPGLIGGPGDPSGRSNYWPLRFAESRDPVLVPADPEGRQWVQIIDVRDLAAFILESGLTGHHGFVNAVGVQHTLGQALRLAREAAGAASSAANPEADHELVEYDAARMEADRVAPWAGPRSLPLVLPAGSGYAGFARRSDTRSLAMGLRRRSLRESFEDIVRSDDGSGTGSLRSGLGAEEESELIAG
ncbi:NAD-dependent epimerase/dehydratase family protein [Paeniglutamicibacter sp. MACA_103]|uniref:NAD-dependent epimerase/dehydratase family protein n=1 Tax=Paeniglutamicibacter sp. MACA_103 TaxID=3377337 RepID=UPI0038943094